MPTARPGCPPRRVWPQRLAVIVALVTGCAVPAAAHAGAQLPPTGAAFDYQIGGAYPPAAAVRIVDRDRTAAPAPGRYGICYINAFQTQPDAVGWWRSHHPRLLLRRHGRLVVDTAWNEILLDTSTAGRRRELAAIIGRWIDGCAASKYQAVEPDNLDSASRSHGALTQADDLALAAALIARAHAAGLAIAQKNTPELGVRGRALGFDFAIAEECNVYAECGSYTAAYGDLVYEIEYPDNGGPANFRAACQARSDRISILYRDRDVVPRGRPGYASRGC